MKLKRLLHMLILAALMLNSVPSANARIIETGITTPTNDMTLRIDLLIVASGQGSGKFGSKTWTTTRNVKIEGSAEVHITGSKAVAKPFTIIVTDDLLSIERSPCGQGIGQRTTHQYITDPARYLGGPDPMWTIASDFQPSHRLDNTWYLDDLFLQHFYGNGELERPFNYRTETQDSCGNTSSVSNTDIIHYDYPIFDVQHQAVLEGDADAKFFERHNAWTQLVQTGYGEIPMSVDFHATVEVIGGCQSQPAPIDASNPLVRLVKVTLEGDDTMQPDDSGNVVRALVTCEGVPVNNLALEFDVKPKAGSGGHLHNNHRPRGYLNGIDMDTEPSLTLHTGPDGRTAVLFEAGKDRLNHTIGIAGEYEITARPMTKPGNTAKFDMWARVPNLNPLVTNDLITVMGEVWNQHMDTHYATNGTLTSLSLLAMDFRDAVNQIPGLVLCDPWPPKLRVNDISLEWGGLFDVRGWDIQIGQMWSAEWEPPHYTHRDGTVVDISANYPCAAPLLRAMLTRLGRQYGTWIGGPVLSLKMDAGLLRSNSAAPTANPDLGVVAFRSDRDVPTVAPGQFITYTVGVGNASNTTPAHNVTLTATLPNDLNFITADPGPTRFGPANQPIWDLGTLALTTTQIMTVVAQVPPTITVGTLLTVTTNASTSDVDLNLGDNHDAAFGVLVQPASADLMVESTLGNVALTIDRPVTTTIDVSNFGTVVAPSTQLTLTLPPSVTLSSSSPLTSTQANGVYKWNLGALNVDESRRLTVTLALSPSLALTQSLPFLLSASSAVAELYPANNTQVITDHATLAGHDAEVWLNVNGGIASGQDITYTLGYANYGNQLAPTSTVTLTLDDALTFISASISATRVVSGTTLAWDLGALPVGAHRTIEVHAKAAALPSSGGVTFAQLTSTGFDIDPANNLAYVIREGYGVAPAKYHLYLPLVRR